MADLKQPHPRNRAHWTLHALVVVGVVIIILAPQVVWLISVMIRPDEVGPVPPTSEAVTTAGITGLFGMLGGAAIAARDNHPSPREEVDGERADTV